MLRNVANLKYVFHKRGIYWKVTYRTI